MNSTNQSKEAIMINTSIQKVIRGEDLSEKEMEETMAGILQNAFYPSQASAFLTALRMKGETVDEITGATRALRSRIHRFQLNNHVVNIDRDDINVEAETILEVADSGQRGTHIFNVSAASTFVVAGAGIRIARYGNRASSRFLGTADVLEYLGINLDISSSDVERSLAEVGIGLMFAPVFHTPMRHVARLREEMGIRTIFNLIGPLANPAGAVSHVLGVYEPDLTEKIAQVIQRLGGSRAVVCCGQDTIDELSICGETKISHLQDGRIRSFRTAPEDYGMQRVDRKALKGGNVRENAEIVRAVLSGEKGPKRDLVLLNSAAAFWAYGLDEAIESGIERAAMIIDSGSAMAKLEALIGFTQQCVPFTLSTVASAG
jgi:anthranilate phosphoribosyltransferase